MTPIWRVSDQEVWTAIHYLDPDGDPDSANAALPRRRYSRRLKASVLALVLVVTLIVAGAQYLPRLIDFFR